MGILLPDSACTQGLRFIREDLSFPLNENGFVSQYRPGYQCVAVAAPKNAVTAATNSSVFSIGGTCPHLSKLTSFAPAIPAAYRSPEVIGSNLSCLPHTTSVGILIFPNRSSNLSVASAGLTIRLLTVYPSCADNLSVKIFRSASSLSQLVS